MTGINPALERARHAYVLALWRLHTEAEQDDEIVFMLNDLAKQSNVLGHMRLNHVLRRCLAIGAAASKIAAEIPTRTQETPK